MCVWARVRKCSGPFFCVHKISLSFHNPITLIYTASHTCFYQRYACSNESFDSRVTALYPVCTWRPVIKTLDLKTVVYACFWSTWNWSYFTLGHPNLNHMTCRIVEGKLNLKSIASPGGWKQVRTKEESVLVFRHSACSQTRLNGQIIPHELYLKK